MIGPRARRERRWPFQRSCQAERTEWARRNVSRAASESTKKPPVAWGVRGLILASAGTFKETFKLSTSHRVLKFPHRLGFDLADPLASDLEDPAHLFERIGVAVTESVTELDDLAFAVSEGLQDLVDLFLEHFLGGRVDRALGGLVLDKVAEVAVFAFADGAVE